MRWLKGVLTRWVWALPTAVDSPDLGGAYFKRMTRKRVLTKEDEDMLREMLGDTADRQYERFRDQRREI